MSVIDKAIAWAKSIASDQTHGYSQIVRWGPSYDCSSFVISAFKQAGVQLTCTYTGNMYDDMLQHGFRAFGPGSEPLQAGDVLLNEAQHTALYIGGNLIVHARSAEGTNDTADNSGDEIRIQTYYDHPWDTILRYEGPDTEGAVMDSGEQTYIVQKGDTLWAIAQRMLGAGDRYKEIMQLSGLTDTTISPGQVLIIKKGTNTNAAPAEMPKECYGDAIAEIDACIAALQELKKQLKGGTL